MKPDLKKLVILNLPYLLFVYLFGKMGEAWRLAAGADASQKLVHLLDSGGRPDPKDAALHGQPGGGVRQRPAQLPPL